MTTRYPLVLNGTSIQELQNSDSLILPSALSITSGGTGLTSFTSGGVVYASSTSALATGSALVFDGTNLGIGTSSPSQKLHVNSAGAAIALIQSTLAAGNTNVETRYISTNRTWGVGQNIIQTSSIFEIADITASATRLAIDSSGNVGIGTSSPTDKLNVFTTATGTTAGSNVVARFSSNGNGYDANITMGDNVNASTRIGYLSGNMYFWTNGSERMRIDTSGNLGLGVTPSAWTSGNRAMQIGALGGVSIVQRNSQESYFGQNFYFDASGTSTRAANGFSTRMGFYNGTVFWELAGSSTAGTTVSYTQAMTLDASGNLGIGTSSPTAKLQIGDATVATSNRIVFGKAIASSESFLPAIGQQSSSGAGNDLALAVTSTSGVVRFYTGASTNSGEIGTGSNTEKMRLDSSGNLGLGVTPSAWSTVTALQIKNASVYGYSTSEAGVNQNAYYGSGNWRYISAVAATAYRQISGAHSWHISSGTPVADGTISFTQAMTLDASGNLLVGATSPVASEIFLVSKVSGSVRMTLQAQATGSPGAALQMLGSTANKNWLVGSSFNYAGALEFTPSTANGGTTFSTPAMMLDSSGNVGIGTTSPTATLQLSKALSSTLTVGANIQNTGIFTWGVGIDNAVGNSTFVIQSSGLGGTTRLAINSSGVIGMGTTNPSNASRLEVQTPSTTAGLWVQTGGTTSGYIIADFRTGTNASALQVLGDNSVSITGTLNQSGALRQQGGVYTTDNTFSVDANTNRRIQVVLGNYTSTKFRIYGLRTNSGNSICYWEGVLNNNYNTSYTNVISSLNGGGGTITLTVSSPTSGTWNFDFNNTSSGGYGWYDKEDIGSGSVTVTTY